MKDNIQTRYGSQDYYYPPGHYVSSSQVIKAQTSFTCRNGETSGDFTSPTSYGFAKSVTNNDEGLYRRKDGPYDAQTWVGPFATNHPRTITWTPWSSNGSLYEDALGDLMNEVRSGNQVVVDLAEAGSTMAMLRATNSFNGRVSEILDIIHGEIKAEKRYFRRLDKRDRTQKILDFATNRWLEYRYGWQPVASSVYTALDILHKENLERVRTIVGRSRLTTEEAVPYSESTFFAGQLQGLYTTRKTERCRVVVEMYTPATGIWDWTSLNPSVIAWELLPLSFVADWFVSVGDSLAYLENWLLWKNQFKSGYVTHTGIGTEDWLLADTATNGYYTLTVKQSGTIESSYKSRIVLTALPLPFAPRVKVNLNAHRTLDAVTLVSTFWRKKIRKFGLEF